MPATQHM